MDYIIPTMIKKKISFLKLSDRFCSSYKIYAVFKDDEYASGTRTELVDEFENPKEDTPVLITKELDKVQEPTWKLPEDAYLDQDHPFYLYQNDFIINTIFYSYNRVTRLITLDTTLKPYSINDDMKIKYYKNIITREYSFEEDCDINIVPIFTDSSVFGNHNIIL